MRAVRPLFSLLLLGLTSCGLLESVPACDDKQVLELVREMHGQRLKESLVRERFRNPLGMLDMASLFEGSELKLADLPNLTYARLNAHRAKSPRIREFLNEIDAEAVKQQGNLMGMRLVNKDEAAKKVTCAATVEGGKGGGQSVEYSAQFTLDKKLHVELP